MLKFVLTKRAENSLEEIIDYHHTTYSAERATKVIYSRDEAFGKIMASPRSYTVCFDIKQPTESIRQIIVHQTFKIVYRIKKDHIEVVEIFHGKRPPGLLKDI